jgi:hypothetical protein
MNLLFSKFFEPKIRIVTPIINTLTHSLEATLKIAILYITIFVFLDDMLQYNKNPEYNSYVIAYRLVGTWTDYGFLNYGSYYRQ